VTCCRVGCLWRDTPHTRMVWDIAAALDPSIEPPLFRPLSQPNEMATLWTKLWPPGYRAKHVF